MVRSRFRLVTAVILAILVGALLCSAQQKKADKSITVVFTDGHQKTFATADVSRIEFKNDAMIVTQNGHQENIPLADVVRMDFGSMHSSRPFGRNHFIGKWEVGETERSGTFTITLEPDGQATKTLGSPHGTWVVVDGEARISWDDGWHDVIKKVGDKHGKFAYEPGRPLTDSPSNVTTAKSLNEQSM